MTTAPLVRSRTWMRQQRALWLAERDQNRIEPQDRKNEINPAVMTRSGLARATQDPSINLEDGIVLYGTVRVFEPEYVTETGVAADVSNSFLSAAFGGKRFRNALFD